MNKKELLIRVYSNVNLREMFNDSLDAELKQVKVPNQTAQASKQTFIICS